MAEVWRQHGISEGTYYRWKAQYGGLEVSQLRRLRELEEENRRLKQSVADLTLDNTALKEITQKTGNAHCSTSSGRPSAADVRDVRTRGVWVRERASADYALLTPDPQ